MLLTPLQAGATTYNYGDISGTSSDGSTYTLSLEGYIVVGSGYGSYSTTGDASGNSATITGSLLSGSLFGGRSTTGSANSNNVTVTDSGVAVEVYGGYADAGNAEGNKVYLNGSSAVTAGIYGGYSVGGSADSNYVYVYGSGEQSIALGTISYSASGYGYVVGGYSWLYGDTDATADKNTVEISPEEDTVTVTLHVSGGVVYYGDSASGNEVTISGDTTVGAAVSGGVVFTGNTVESNTVTINGGTIYGATVSDFFADTAVVGGGLGYVSGTSGTVAENEVVISGGTVYGNVYGGYSIEDDGSVSYSVTSNTVTLSGGIVYGTVYGGRGSAAGTVSGNTVTVTGGNVEYGTASLCKVTGTFDDYSIEYSTSTLDMGIYGGYSDGTGEVSGNAVYIGAADDDDSEVTYSEINISGKSNNTGTISGGYSSGSGNATGNYVYVGGTPDEGSLADSIYIAYGTLYGGYSSSGTVSENYVYLYNGTINDTQVYGGYSYSGEAYNNTVTLTGTYASSDEGSSYSLAVSSEIYGGYSYANDATYNSLYIYPGVKVKVVYGGRSKSGNANYNKVTVSGSTTTNDEGTTEYSILANTIYGGYSYDGEASYNTVKVENVSGNTSSLSIYGGCIDRSSNGAGDTNYNEVYVDGVTCSLIEVADNSVGNSIGNVLEVKNSTASRIYAVYAGYTVDNNKVTVKDSTIAGDFQIVSYNGSITNNTISFEDVTFSGENTTYGELHGARSFGTSSDDSTVEIKNNSITFSGSDSNINALVYGTYLDGSGTISNNSITINDGYVYYVVGAFISSGTVSENKVTLNGGSTSFIIGAYSYSSSNTINDNHVYIYGGTSAGTIWLAYGYGKAEGNGICIDIDSSTQLTTGSLYATDIYDTNELTGNYVSVSGNAYVDGCIYGAKSTAGTVTGNYVKLGSSDS